MKNGMIELSSGDRIWYLNGELHRVDGPAIERSDGYRAWYLNGERHRVDGPAIEWSNGTREWYLNGKRYTFAEWLENNPHLDNKKRIMYRLKYSEEQTT